jgi:hypothetical protein
VSGKGTPSMTKRTARTKPKPGSKYVLTDAHRAKLKPWAERWIANAMSTAPMNDADRDAMRVAVNGLHAAADLPAPGNIVFTSGPISGAIAAGIAAGVWYLRENPGQQGVLFGRKLSELELMAAIPYACVRAVAAARHRTDTLQVEPRKAVPRSAAATDAATAAATRAATADATAAATADATDAATADATAAATDAATAAATRAATDAATAAATADATRAATAAATRAATAAATYAATYAATRAATDAATNAATAAATYAATYAATRAATAAATRAATDAATNAATADATYAATAAATRAATDAATNAATADAVDLEPLVAFLMRCTAYHWRMWNCGNHASAWPSYLSFFRHVAQLPLDYSKWQHFEAAAIHGSHRWMHQRFCIVSDRPELIRVDGDRRPHCEDGPSHRWRDGFELYHWRGTRIPKAWIAEKTTLAPETAINWPNVEQRRVAAEIVGWTRILDQLGAVVVHADPNPQIGTLRRCDLPGSPGEQFLQVKCGTGRDFALPVPPTVKTAMEAQEWMWGLEPGEYQLEVRT